MRIVKVISLIILMSFIAISIAKDSDVIKIIEVIVNDNRTSHISYVNLLTTENYLKDVNRSDFMANLMNQISKSKTVMLINENFMDRLSKKRILLTVIFTNSLDEFIKLASKFSHLTFNYAGYYVILFENAKELEVHQVFQILWSLYIRNVNLIRWVEESIIVETFFPFTSTYCNKTHPVKVADYENGNFSFKPNEFFPKKFQKFYNCTISMTSFTALSPSVLKREFSNGTFELYGRDIEMLKTLSFELNFYANNTYLHPFGSWGVMSPNKTFSGGIGMAQRRSTDFVFGNINLKHDRVEIMDFCFGYYLEILVFVIPRGLPFSPFHKLIRPFHNFVWICVLMVLVACVVVILILSFLPKKFKSFVYGENVTTPFLNVIIAMYGGAQNILPKYNFSRSLLMMFLLFCLVLRSLYQGSLFKFLQANDNQPEVASIDEMAENNFKFYMIPSYDDMTRNNAAMKGKRVIIDPLDQKGIMNRTLNSQFAGSVIDSISDVLYKNKIKAHNREELYKVCKQPFTTIPITMWFPKNSYLVEPIDEKLIWYQCSGLLQYWASFEEDSKYLSYTDVSKGPKPMSVENFSATFQIWSFACGLGFIIFILEKFCRALESSWTRIQTNPDLHGVTFFVVKHQSHMHKNQSTESTA
ncbi:unnamed protein product [Chironomus riparius]|uniref:Ionotropic receptor n=1 Tax=Chironomus riparius TaxID=315576 RepID=A0A9N9RTD2_9DIPT|nr:unnamed protein product [Chironomus riparius]